MSLINPLVVVVVVARIFYEISDGIRVLFTDIRDFYLQHPGIFLPEQ